MRGGPNGPPDDLLRAVQPYAARSGPPGEGHVGAKHANGLLDVILDVAHVAVIADVPVDSAALFGDFASFAAFVAVAAAVVGHAYVFVVSVVFLFQ